MGSRFDAKIKPMLKYIGTIGACLMGIAYIAIVLILVFGFTASASFSQSITFALVNAVMGLVIMQFLKVQGIDLAKDIDENKKILEQYYKTNTADKKHKSIKYYWISSVIKDTIIKGLTFIFTTVGIIYIVITGTENYTWLLLALVNLLMFGCFGLLSLVGAYDFFNEQHIPYIQERLDEANKEREKALEAEVQRRLDMAKAEYIHKENDSSSSNSRTNILESSDSVDSVSNHSEPMVVDGSFCDYRFLGRSADAGDCSTVSTNTICKENI